MSRSSSPATPMPDRVAALVADLREDPARLAAPNDLTTVMEQRRIPGVGLAIVADGRSEWAGGFGVRDADAGDLVTEETLFQAGSISKPVAALCALRLVEDGSLDLDEDVNERLASWRVPAVGTWHPRLTLRQLLSHTAGLTVHGFPGYGRDEPAPELVGVLDGHGNTVPVRVRTIPGLQFSYSGGGYCVLQQLLVDVVGEPFPELARRLVLEPLGMDASTYEQPLPGRLRTRAAAGHRTGGSPVAGRWHVYPEMAAAGLWTTPADLARFAVAIQRSHAGADGAILPAHLVGEMLTPQAPNAPMGLGLLVDGDGATKRFWHGGDDQGFVAWLAGYVERGFAAVVMTNSDSGMWVIAPLVEAVARGYGWPEYPGADEVELRQATEAEAERCAGTYESDDGGRFTLERRGRRLFLIVPGQAPIELAPASPTEWHAIPLAATLTFELAANGQPSSGRLHQDAEYVRDLELKRIAERSS